MSSLREQRAFLWRSKKKETRFKKKKKIWISEIPVRLISLSSVLVDAVELWKKRRRVCVHSVLQCNAGKCQWCLWSYGELVELWAFSGRSHKDPVHDATLAAPFCGHRWVLGKWWHVFSSYTSFSGMMWVHNYLCPPPVYPCGGSCGGMSPGLSFPFSTLAPAEWECREVTADPKTSSCSWNGSAFFQLFCLTLPPTSPGQKCQSCTGLCLHCCGASDQPWGCLCPVAYVIHLET